VDFFDLGEIDETQQVDQEMNARFGEVLFFCPIRISSVKHEVCTKSS